METYARILVADMRTTVQLRFTTLLPPCFPEMPRIITVSDSAKIPELFEAQPFDAVLFGKGFSAQEASGYFTIVRHAQSTERNKNTRFALLVDTGNLCETSCDAIDCGADDAIVRSMLDINPRAKEILQQKMRRLVADRVEPDREWGESLSPKDAEYLALEQLRTHLSTPQVLTFKRAAGVLSTVFEAAAKHTPIPYGLLVRHISDIRIASLHKKMREPLISVVNFPRLRHSLQVATFADVFAEMYAEEIGLKGVHKNQLFIAALLHDIGWMQIDTRMFPAGGEWDDGCRKEMQRHSQLGAWVLNDSVPGFIIDGVREHHERMDGSGYPFGLKGTDEKGKAILSDAGRIMAVLDSFEAQVFSRDYRILTKVGMLEAVQSLKEVGVSGEPLYCPKYVQCLEAMVGKIADK